MAAIECPGIEARDWSALTAEHWEQLTAGWSKVYASQPDLCIATPDNLIDTWAALIHIKTKTHGVQRLLANTTQLYILSAIYGMRQAALPVRIIILKGRQQGSTTGVMGYQFMETITTPESGAMVIADQADHASNIFEMYRLAY